MKRISLKGNKRGSIQVEDEPARAEIVQDILEGKGFKITHVDAADQAFKTNDVAKFDIMVLDIMLPDGDGFPFINKNKIKRSIYSCHLFNFKITPFRCRHWF